MTAYERRIRDWSSDVCSSDLTTEAFSFHHGKDGTATTGREVKLPDGASVVEVPEVPGWTSSVDEAEGVVSWTGGSVPDGQDGVFPVVLVLPPTPGEVLFPTVQITEAGELAWIDEEQGEGEDVSSAPRLTLAAAPNAAATTTTTTEAEPNQTTPGPVEGTTTTNDPTGSAPQAEAR